LQEQEKAMKKNRKEKNRNNQNKRNQNKNRRRNLGNHPIKEEKRVCAI
jgi:hypothetical protein